MIKDTDKEPATETHTARSERVLNAGASVPMELGVSPSWHMDVFTNLELPELHTIELSWRLLGLVIPSF